MINVDISRVQRDKSNFGRYIEALKGLLPELKVVLNEDCTSMLEEIITEYEVNLEGDILDLMDAYNEYEDYTTNIEIANEC